MDPDVCDSAGPVAAPPPPIEPTGACDPSYVQCIPSPPPDLDCYDIGFEVDVVGDDPHGLDADFDGAARRTSGSGAQVWAYSWKCGDQMGTDSQRPANAPKEKARISRPFLS